MKPNKNYFQKAYLLLAVLCLFVRQAQGQQAQKFFPKKDLMTVGVYYYPEHWPRSQWGRDLKNMSDMGFEFTHYGEFAWAMMEPEEGKYDFTWLDEAVALAAKHKLKVIMCTPTPTPPVWLVKKHPEVLMVNKDGVTMQHGSRQHISWSSKVYQSYVDKIVTQLAKRYGHDKRIWGWQIDNEPSHYDQHADYNKAAQANFREWLQNKYKTIDGLNKAWGTAFWSLRYSSFDQVDIPNPKEQPQGINPHAQLDFKRFNAQEAARFVSFQHKLLRSHISPEQWVTTNYMHQFPSVDPWLSDDLDFISYTNYPLAGYSDGKGEEGFRVGEHWRVPYSMDFFRPLKRLTGVMEMQIGQVNWGNYQPKALPGTIRAYLWHTFAGGAAFSCSYRFRQPLYGYEYYIEGMVGPDGVTPTYGGREYMQFIKEMKEIRKLYKPNATMPQAFVAKKAGILWNFDNMWDSEYQKQTRRWNMSEHVIQKYYVNLKALGAPVDFISEKADFSAYPVLVAPAYQVLDQVLVAKWKQYVQAGGHLVLSCRTGQKDKNGQLWEAKWAEPIHELIGGQIDFYDNLPADKKGKITMNNQTYTWNVWADVLAPAQGTQVLGTFDNQFYKGKAAVTRHKLGKGSVTFVGVDSEDGRLEKAVLQDVYTQAGVQAQELPEGVYTEWRDGFWVTVNYGEKPYEANLPAKAKIIFGSKILKQAEVLVWME